jgi:excisionase family DNA binding protein
MNRTLLTAAQVANLLGVPKSWVYEQSRRGLIPTVTLGRYRRYRAEAIAEWVRSQEAAESTSTTATNGRSKVRPIRSQRAGSKARG